MSVMTKISVNLPPAPTVTTLQRAWLREIGIEKVWLQARTPIVPVAQGRAMDIATESPVPQGRPMDTATELPVPQDRLMGTATEPSVPQGRPMGTATEPLASQRRLADTVTVASASPGPSATIAAVTSVSEVSPGALTSGVAAAAGAAAREVAVKQTHNITQLDINELRHQVVTCTACGLCQGRQQAVFGSGATPASWLVVGEAPGEQEDRQGLPFVGRSGQLLNAMLAAVGMSREQNVFITNVIKCRPPGNRNPKPEEIAACSPYLMRQIALLQPARILVLGRFAAQTLLGTDASIGSLRGRLHRLKTEQGEIPVVVSYHPAYLLRSPSEKARSWQDLRLMAHV